MSSNEVHMKTEKKSVERQQTGRDSLRESVASMMVGAPMKTSNAELELIVDGLKRVIERQKTEIDQLKRKDTMNTKHHEKV